MKIMSVDDSEAVRSIIRNAVEMLDYEFVGKANGKEAFDYLEKENPDIDLILLDWNMPTMDGITFLKKIKADERFKGIVVTMITTENEKDRVVEAISSGAKNYLIKPFSQELLISRMMEALGMGF